VGWDVLRALVPLVLREFREESKFDVEKFVRKYGIERDLLLRLSRRYSDFLLLENNFLIVKDKVSLILRLLSESFSPEELLRYLSWSEFEEYTERVLEKLGFNVVKKVTFSSQGKRFEIDLVAIRGGTAFVIECKYWKRLRGRGASLAKSAKRHLERVEAFKNLAFKILGPYVHEDTLRIYPLLVSFYESDLGFVEGVPIVPISKLVAFMKRFYLYDHVIATITVKRCRLHNG